MKNEFEGDSDDEYAGQSKPQQVVKRNKKENFVFDNENYPTL